MQGKERNNQEIDEQFVSHAWGAMRGLLDGEMPVTEPPVIPEETSGNRYALLLLLLLIGFGAGAGWMYWYFQTKPVIPPEPPAPRAMMYEAPTNDQTLIANIKNTKSEKNITLNTTSTFNTESSVIAPPNAIPKSLDHSSSKQMNLPPESSTGTAPPPIRFGWVPADAQGEYEELLAKATPVEAEKVAAPIHKALDGTQKENAKSSGFSTDKGHPGTTSKASTSIENMQTLKNTEGVVVPEKAPELDLFLAPVGVKRWRLALEVSRIRDNETKEFGGSLSMGLMVERRLDNRFSLQSGLAWHHLVKRPQSIEDNSNTLNALGNDPSLDFVLEDYYANAVQTGALQVMDYIKLPLQMNYKINRFLRIHTGVNIGYLLDPIGFRKNDEPPLGENELPTEEILTNTRSKFVRAGLRKIDFGMQVGAGIYPTERIGLFLNYNSGLLDFSDNEHFQFKEVHSNQYLQLGLIYYPFKR